MRRSIFLLIALVVMPLLSGCSLLIPGPRFESDGAEEQLARIARLNEAVTTFKGTGSVIIREKGTSRRFRIAWAGAEPNRLRMEILASATPLESLAYDGSHIQMRSHIGSHKPIRRKLKNPSLEPVTGIPMTLAEIHALLSGKFFVGEFKNARFLTSDQGAGTLILRPDWSRIITITLDEDNLPTRSTLTKGEKEVYDIRLTRKTTPQGLNQFNTIDLTTESGIATTIRIDRMIVNPPVDEEMFTLD